MYRRPLLALALLLPTLAPGQTWSCSGVQEIACTAGRCEPPAADFTPLQLTLRASGRLEVCAYSGCWAGPARRWRDGPHLHASAHALRRSGAPAERAAALLGLDTGARIATLQFAGLVVPMVCERGGPPAP